jgi:hypothetical protein
MNKLFNRIGLTILFVLTLFSFSFCADEEFKITTYYPSPYGSYNELRAKRVAVGDNYIDGANYTWGEEVDSQADLVVEGSVGIGTADPGNSKLIAVSGNSSASLAESSSNTIVTSCSKKICGTPTTCSACCGGVYQSTCFTSDMKISLKEGAKPIGQIKEGDLVKSFDLEKKQIVYSKVNSIIKREVDSFYLINEKIEVTQEHPFYTDQGWKKVKELKVGDLLFDGKDYIAIKDIKEITRKVMVYNLSVGSLENFFAEGVLVHNKPMACVGGTGHNNYACTTSSCNSTCCDGVEASTTTGYGIRAGASGFTNSYAGFFDGNVSVGGNLTTTGNSTTTGNISVGGGARVAGLIHGPLGNASCSPLEWGCNGTDWKECPPGYYLKSIKTCTCAAHNSHTCGILCCIP